jgi:hypothetical protein
MWLIDGPGLDNGPEDIRYAKATIGSPIKSRSSHDFGVNGMHFTVYSATGGKVVQFNTYDPARDRSDTRLYIVTDKDELGEELAQIITRESLTR